MRWWYNVIWLDLTDFYTANNHLRGGAGSERAGQCNLSAGFLSTCRVDKGGVRHTDMKTDQILFPRRAAVKGNCVTASPPGIPTARKHGEMKDICSDTAVSEHTTQHKTTQHKAADFMTAGLFVYKHTQFSHSACSQTSAASAASYPLKPCYWFTLCSDSAHNSSPTFSLSTRAHVVVGRFLNSISHGGCV